MFLERAVGKKVELDFLSWKVWNEIGKNEVGKLGLKFKSLGRSWKVTDEVGML